MKLHFLDKEQMFKDGTLKDNQLVYTIMEESYTEDGGCEAACEIAEFTSQLQADFYLIDYMKNENLEEGFNCLTMSAVPHYLADEANCDLWDRGWSEIPFEVLFCSDGTTKMHFYNKKIKTI